MCWAQLLCGMRSGSSLQGAAGWCSRVVVSQKFNPFFAFVLSHHPKEWVVISPKGMGGDGQESECGGGGKGVQGEAVASSDENNKQLL